MNFGVDRSHIGKERYVINGLNATEAEALIEANIIEN
jgi:hypothetical protein